MICLQIQLTRRTLSNIYPHFGFRAVTAKRSVCVCAYMSVCFPMWVYVCACVCLCISIHPALGWAVFCQIKEGLMLSVKQPAVWFGFSVHHNSSHRNITPCSAPGVDARCFCLCPLVSTFFSLWRFLGLSVSLIPCISFALFCTFGLGLSFMVRAGFN